MNNAVEQKAIAQARPKGTAQSKERKFLRPLGFLARLLTYGLLFVVWWNFAPKDISNIPFAALTLSMVLSTVLWIAIGFYLVKWLFKPSQEIAALDAWNAVGLLLAVAAALGGGYLWNA